MDPKAAYLVAREDAIHRAGIVLAPPPSDDTNAEAKAIGRKALKVADGDPCPIHAELVPEFDDLPLGDQVISVKFLADDLSGHASMAGSAFADLPMDRLEAVAKKARELHDRFAGDTEAAPVVQPPTHEAEAK